MVLEESITYSDRVSLHLHFDRLTLLMCLHLAIIFPTMPIFRIRLVILVLEMLGIHIHPVTLDLTVPIVRARPLVDLMVPIIRTHQARS